MDDLDDRVQADNRVQADDSGIVQPPVAFGAAVGLLAVATAGAATAGVLDAVGPYLLGVSALLVALVGLVALGRR